MQPAYHLQASSNPASYGQPRDQLTLALLEAAAGTDTCWGCRWTPRHFTAMARQQWCVPGPPTCLLPLGTPCVSTSARYVRIGLCFLKPTRGAQQLSQPDTRQWATQCCREQVDTTKMPFAAIGMIRLQSANDSGAGFCTGTLISQVRDLAPDMRLHPAPDQLRLCCPIAELVSSLVCAFRRAAPVYLRALHAVAAGYPAWVHVCMKSMHRGDRLLTWLRLLGRTRRLSWQQATAGSTLRLGSQTVQGAFPQGLCLCPGDLHQSRCLCVGLHSPPHVRESVRQLP